MKRKGLLRPMKTRFGKRFEKSYARYKELFKKAKRQIHRRGYKMADERMLTRRDFKMAREIIKDNGLKSNLTEKIVSEQKYEYSQKIARQFKKVAEEFDLEWKDVKITELRKAKIDVSKINDKLKEMYPKWTGYDRADYISHEVFGS